MKKFTLIELIIVIAVLGILASIIIPNIKNLQQKAFSTAVVSNVNIFQTAVDMYSLDHFGKYPTKVQPTLKVPEPLLVNELKLDYIRNTPKTNGIYYWVDSYGKVWGSSVDSPVIKKDTTELSWNEVEGASSYHIYEILDNSLNKSTINNEKFRYITSTKELVYHGEAGKNYAVSAVDVDEFESPPSSFGYRGYEIELGEGSPSEEPIVQPSEEPKETPLPSIKNPAAAPASPNYQLVFDGVDDYVNAGNNSKFVLTTGTLVARIKTPDAGSAYRAIAIKQGAYGLFLYNNILVLYDWKTQQMRPTNVELNDNEWHTVAVSFQSGVTNGTVVYVDGIPKLTTTITVNHQTSPFSIGASMTDTNVNLAQNFYGGIDDVSLWNKILTPAEISSYHPFDILGNEAGLVSFWNMNETTGTIAHDFTMNLNNGTVQGAVWRDSTYIIPIKVKDNHYLTFSGNSSYVDLKNSTAVKLSKGTFIAKIKTSNAGTEYRGILVKQSAYGLFLYNNELTLYDWGTMTPRRTGVMLNDNQWHTVAVTFNSGVTNGTTIYVDGIPKLTTTMTISNQTVPLYIGASGNSSNPNTIQNFIGAIDQVSVLNTVLSENEIITYGNGTFSGSELNLVGSWDMEEGAGTTLYDKTANALHGTIYNATWTK